MDRVLNRILTEYRKQPGNLIWLLGKVQEAYGYIPEDVVKVLSENLDIPESRFFGIITFYPKFRTRQVGKNIITICCGAACHIKGSSAILESAREALGLAEGEDTSRDLKFTIQTATCIGACNIAPVVITNSQVHGGMDPAQVKKLIKGYSEEDEFIGFI